MYIHILHTCRFPIQPWFMGDVWYAGWHQFFGSATETHKLCQLIHLRLQDAKSCLHRHLPSDNFNIAIGW